MDGVKNIRGMNAQVYLLRLIALGVAIDKHEDCSGCVCVTGFVLNKRQWQATFD